MSVPSRAAKQSVGQDKLQEYTDSALTQPARSASSQSAMGLSPKPIVFISYAHADEPHKPAEGDTKWLSFVTGFLRVPENRGILEVWTDRTMLGGEEWDPEIEGKLQACDIFLLLVSPNSVSSSYIIRREIEVVPARQKKGEDSRRSRCRCRHTFRRQ
jgi:hypothetical protein